MQLEKLIHSQGFGSRKECRALIRAGMVVIDGQVADDPRQDFVAEGLRFEVDGEEWTYRNKAYLMLHKPAGHECSRQPQFHPSVYALLPWPLIERGVQSVGRLDHDSTGLLLFSDDGQFIHSWSSGKKQIPKVYRAELAEPVEARVVEALLKGVSLHDEPEPIRAVACVPLDERSIELTVTEGKYHLVKRMVAAAGGHVEALHRTRIGGLELPPDLLDGEWCWLEEDHMRRLQSWTLP